MTVEVAREFVGHKKRRCPKAEKREVAPSLFLLCGLSRGREEVGAVPTGRLLVAAVASQIGGEDDGLKERLKGRKGDGDGERPKILSK